MPPTCRPSPSPPAPSDIGGINRSDRAHPILVMQVHLPGIDDNCMDTASAPPGTSPADPCQERQRCTEPSALKPEDRELMDSAGELPREGRDVHD
jgi:hypothetical protein